jgi:uncharacterized tellurite resistance protein B-like protein
MSIAEIFESGERKQHKSHFTSLVLMAQSDGVFSDDEQKLIAKIGKGIGLSQAQMDELIKDAAKYPVNPPVSKEDRITRLVELVEVIYSDGVLEDNEVSMFQRFGTALGFSDDQMLDTASAVIKGLSEGKNTEQIVEGLL